MSELLHHLEECELFPVACPLGCRDEKGEVSRVERRRVESHRTFCPMRTVKCEYCSNGVKACGILYWIIQVSRFYIGLYKFQGCVKWNETEYYLGIFLHIIKGEWDDKLKWPIKYRYSIALVNQLDAKNNYEINDEITDETLEKFSVCFRKPITEGNDGFGPFDFISHADLLEEYSRNDEITLNISVELILNT